MYLDKIKSFVWTLLVEQLYLDLSVISPNRGAVYGQTVCQDNRNVFFYSDDGFYQLSGDTISPIGVEKVNRFFDLDLNKAYTDRIKAAVDPFNQLAMWAYPSKIHHLTIRFM